MPTIVITDAKTGKVISREMTAKEISSLKPTAQQLRQKRDEILLDVDAIAGNALRWADMTTEERQAWATYRRALLDVPQQDGFPSSVTWPVPPST